MNEEPSNTKLEWAQPWVYRARGWLMFLFGTALIVFTALNPHVKILSTDFSWLPLIGAFLIVVGGVRFMDAFLSRRQLPRLVYNLQAAILDTVSGFLVLFSISEEAVTVALLVAGYLMTQGLNRLALPLLLPFRNPTPTRITGAISMALGFAVFLQWPASTAWALSLALSGEIAGRGWALIQLAEAVQNQTSRSSA